MKKLFALIIIIVLCLASPVFPKWKLKTNTATVILVGPFLDYSDGVTPETAMTVTNITCELYKYTIDGSAPTRTALTLTASGGDNDMVHITSDVAGMYSLELTASNVNFLGEARLCFTDPDVCGSVWEDIEVVPAHVRDTWLGSDYLHVNSVEISDDSTTADNLQTITEEMLIVFDTDWATNYDTTLDRWNVDAEAISGDTTTADNLQTMTANMLVVYSTDFATNYDATYDMWNVDTEKMNGNDVPCLTVQIVSDGASASDVSTQIQTDMQSDPTDFPVDAKYVNGTAQTANDNGLDINTLITQIGTAGNGLTAVPWNASWDAEVESEVDDSIGGGTGTALTSIPYNASWDAEIQSEVDDALVARFLDRIFGTAYDPSSKPGNASSYLNVLVENDGGVPRFTTNALENASAGGAVYAESGSVATGLSTTILTLGSGVQNDDAFVYMVIAIQDADDSHWESRSISAYTGSTRTVTVSQAFSFTPATGDAFRIMESSYAVPSTGGGGWW